MMEIRRSPNISGFFLSLVIVVEYLRRHGHPSGPRPGHDEDLGTTQHAAVFMAAVATIIALMVL